MNAVLAPPDRFATFTRPDLSEAEKLRRIQVQAKIMARFRLQGVTARSYRCTVCNSRVDVNVRHDAAGCAVGHTGKCRTPNCLNWEV